MNGCQFYKSLTCDHATLKAIGARYGHLDPIALAAVLYMLFGGSYDKQTDQLCIGVPMIEAIIGQPLRYKGGPLSSGKLVLDWISTALPGFSYSDYVAGERYRTITSTGLDPDIVAMVQADLSLPAEALGRRVHVSTENVYSSRSKKSLLDEARARVGTAEYVFSAPSTTARTHLLALNHESNASHRYPTSPDAIDSALEAVADLKSAPGKDNKELRQESALKALRAYQDQPVPVYQFSRQGRTDRVFGLCQGALGLPKSVRRALFSGDAYVEVDLHCAQLAVAARVFELDELWTFLASGDSIWERLFYELGLKRLWGGPLQEAVRAHVKVAVYSLVFGMGRNGITHLFREAMTALGISCKSITATPVFKQILKRRKQFYEAIEQRGYIETPTGIAATYEKGVYAARQALATCFQAYEQRIMSPILRYETDHREAGGLRDFAVLLWLHDGAQLHFTRKRASHLQALADAVHEAADMLEVPTRLVVE